MFPIRHLIAISFLIGVLESCSVDTEPENCDAFISQYNELGCIPVRQNGSTCPVRFDCPLMKQLKKDKCYYKSSSNKVFHDIDTRFTRAADDNPCFDYCYCRKLAPFSLPGLLCSGVEGTCRIHPYLNDDESHCLLQFHNMQCCPYNKICDEEELEEMEGVCEWDGISYRLGERFMPSGTCSECTCTKDWKGQPDGFYCKRKFCLPTANTGAIMNKCATMYFSDNTCCNYRWVCQSTTDKLVRACRKNSDPKMKCQYGNWTLGIGDKVLINEDKCLQCSCQIPPLVTCIRDPACSLV